VLRQITCLAFDDVISRNLIGCVEEIASVAGHDRSFWSGVFLTGGPVFRNAIRDCLRIRRSYRQQVETIRNTPLRYHLFDVFSQCHERGAHIVTGNPPFDEWIGVFGSER
jgi:hypothetical protein